MRSMTKMTFSLALASLLVVTGCGSSQNSSSAPSASPSSNVSVGAAQDQSSPSSAPVSSKPAEGCLSGGPDVAKGQTKGMKWEINPEGGRNLFSIEGAGPCSTGPGGLRTGYAHTAAGALSAALNYDAQISSDFPTSETPDRMKHALAKSEDSSALIKTVEEKLKNGVVPNSQNESLDKSLKVTKYQIVSYSEESARVRALVTIPGYTETLVGTMDLRWENNDWKMVPVSSTTLAQSEKGGEPSGMTSLPGASS